MAVFSDAKPLSRTCAYRTTNTPQFENLYVAASMWVSFVKHFFCRSSTFNLRLFPKGVIEYCLAGMLSVREWALI